jgi:hypothetical protein
MSEVISNNLGERWLPAEWETPDAAALQALARGDATPEQQRHALKVVVEKLAGAYQATFVPRESDTSAFLQGRRDVGMQVVKLLKVDLAALRQIAAAKKTTTARKGNKP